MADSSLTTVVVVSYNYGRYLRDAVRSAVEQTKRPKVLIIDNASTDETPRVIGELLVEYPGLVYHPLPANIGLARLRNLAATLAATDWVVYLDSDDWLDRSYVARAEAWLATHSPVDVLTTDMAIVSDGGRTRVIQSRVPKQWRDLLVRNTIVQGSFIRRALIDEIGGYDPSLAFEDWDFWIRAVKSGAAVARLPGAHLYWRHHGLNFSKTCDEVAASAAVRTKHGH